MFSMILFAASAFWVSSGFTQDCYGQWLDAYDNASQEWMDVQNGCVDRLFPDMCLREAGAAYNQDVNAAGDAYYCCVMGC